MKLWPIRRKTMTTAHSLRIARTKALLHADGSIDIDAYRAIALVERRKALNRFWLRIAAGIKPKAARPMARGYAARLG